jgi:hypothetical protein
MKQRKRLQTTEKVFWPQNCRLCLNSWQGFFVICEQKYDGSRWGFVMSLKKVSVRRRLTIATWSRLSFEKLIVIGLDLFGLMWGPYDGSCQHRIEPYVFIKCEEVYDRITVIFVRMTSLVVYLYRSMYVGQTGFLNADLGVTSDHGLLKITSRWNKVTYFDKREVISNCP